MTADPWWLVDTGQDHSFDVGFSIWMWVGLVLMAAAVIGFAWRTAYLQVRGRKWFEVDILVLMTVFGILLWPLALFGVVMMTAWAFLVMVIQAPVQRSYERSPEKAIDDRLATIQEIEQFHRDEKDPVEKERLRRWADTLREGQGQL